MINLEIGGFSPVKGKFMIEADKRRDSHLPEICADESKSWCFQPSI